MIWTPDRLELLRRHAREAMRYALREDPATTIWGRLDAVASVTGTFLLLGIAAGTWDRAKRTLGAPAMRPLHRLLMELAETMGDPDLRAEKGERP